MSHSTTRPILMLLAPLLFGCAAAVAQSQPQHKDTATPKGARSGDLSIPGGPIAIPQNAGSKYSKRSLVLYLNITTTKSGSIDLSPGGLQAMKSYIEAELPRLKRFKVYAMHNDGARRLVKELQDIGDVEYEPTTILPAPDLTLNLSMDIQVEFAQMNTKVSDEIYYRSVLSMGLTDEHSGENIAGQNFEAQQDRKVRMAFNPATGKKEFTGGFDPKNLDNVNKVLQQLGRKQLINLALFLGRQYPITCNITTLSRTLTRFGGDQGFENGLRNDVDVVIWGDDGGIPTALAAASVEAGADKSAFTVSRWNDGEPDAALWIEELKKDRSQVPTSGLMATSYSMPIPEEWKKGD